ncbi:MAG: hypothetical protein AAF847_02515 [Bacteroidota bacterium]
MKWTSIIAFFLLLAACSSSTLDETFDERFYDGYYKKMVTEQELDLIDLFLLNYSIIQQRDYYNYEVEGKTYRELLEQARAFNKDGLPVKLVYEKTKTVKDLSIKVSNDGFGTMRPNPKSSRLVKVFRFNATYKNESAKDLALLNTSFIITGPFGEYITTAGYEINCLLPAGEQVEIPFMVEARTIRNNVLYDINYDIDRVDLDNLIYNLDVTASGYDATTKTNYFDLCIQQSSARRTPFQVIDFENININDMLKTNEAGDFERFEVKYTYLEREEEELQTIDLGR